MDLPAVGRLANHRLRASRYLLRRSSQTHHLIFCEDHVGSNDPVISINGRGGIRTHAGVSPHDFQSCALSHSATRPRPFVPRKGTDHPFSGGSGMDLGIDLACARSSRETTLSTHSAPYPSLDQKPLRDLLRRAPSKTLPSFPKRGFEPHCRTASFLQRRESPPSGGFMGSHGIPQNSLNSFVLGVIVFLDVSNSFVYSRRICGTLRGTYPCPELEGND